MSDSSSDRPDGVAVYSERLLGLHSECPVCSGQERSTGWLLRREEGGFEWLVELRCTNCGSRGGTWKRDWTALIDEVIEGEVD